ncbi:MAG: 30S ribosomal protein S9 [Planctomycetaceae bacterium]|nr:30S ribosomal protein S9 [Planctomycetaceae bacterium]
MSDDLQNPVEPVEQQDAPPSDVAETPTLASGLDIGSESSPVEGEEDSVAPYFEPKIRGKVDKFGVAWGTGRRKTSVARVRVKEGSGTITVNGRPFEDYFRIERDRGFIQAPLKAVEALGKVDVAVAVNGGGITGQTGAVVLGLARALQARDPQNHHKLSEGGFLTRDSRMVERKKYGKKGARRSFQFSKR